MTTIQSSEPVYHTSVTGLLPIVGSVFLGFLAVGLPLAALPIEMRDHLGCSPATIGATIGLQSLATLATRHRAGTLSDQHGPRRAVLIGLPVAALSGLAYLFAGSLPVGPDATLAILIFGRLVMGLGESLFLTELMSWGIARLGADRTGKVMSWTGMRSMPPSVRERLWDWRCSLPSDSWVLAAPSSWRRYSPGQLLS